MDDTDIPELDVPPEFSAWGVILLMTRLPGYAVRVLIFSVVTILRETFDAR